MKKRGMESEVIVWWIVGIFVLVLFAGIMIYNKGSMGGAIAKMESLFRFGKA